MRRCIVLSLIPILAASAYGQLAASADIPLCPLREPEFKDPDHMTRPKYPKQALRDGTAGTLRLSAVVDASGKTKELTVLDGPVVFEKPSLDAARKWHFHPVVVKNQPVETTYTIWMTFNLALQEAIPRVTVESPRPAETPLPQSDEALTTTDGPVYRASPGSGIVGPKVVYQIEPEFSDEARKAKRQGNVTIRLVVGTDGLPRDLRLVCGAEAGLSEKALDSVKQWRFTPGTKDGKPVPVQIEVAVEFKLY